jgi:hypothetical protein
MRLTQKRKEGLFYFVVEQHAGRVPGGEVEICVFSSREGEGILVLQRSLYFDEQSLQHIDNFCREFAYDDHYREICIRGTAHWCRVARLYELNAGIIVEEKSVQQKNVNKTCKELFHFIRRDLDRIESLPEYKREMARISQGEETALHDTLVLLAKVAQLEVASACQGSSSLKLGGRQIFLPSCHTAKATVIFTSLPASFRHYLQSGPLGQQHLARLGPTRISSTRACHNRLFIRLLTASALAYLQKHEPHRRQPS